MTPDALVRTVEEFLSQAHDAVVLEDGAVAFDLAQAKYSISGERNKCLLHLWSAERNVVRRVVDLEIKNEVLRLAVQRLGQSHPTKLEICRQRDRRTPTAKRAARLAYQRLLQRVLTRKFPGFKVATRLTHCADERAARERFAQAIAQVRDLMPEAEIALLSSSEMAFRCHGLEFARARLTHDPSSFRSTPEIVFGVGAAEQTLRPENAGSFKRLLRSIGEVRHAEGPRDHFLWRLHPERWLESLVIKNVGVLDERFDAGRLYSQVPAFSASDRAMIDVLTTTRQERLAVVELKADEDIHLPLQGLDYWSRVAWHHARGEFQRFGYFSGKELSPEAPLLLLVAPALHVHPATDTLLRYISPEIEWTLVAIDERWREGVRVVFRKRCNSLSEPNSYSSGHALSSLRTSTNWPR